MILSVSICNFVLRLKRNKVKINLNGHDDCRLVVAASDCRHVRVEVPLEAGSVSAHLSADYLCRYHFLTVECRAYLAPLESNTIYFLKSLINGQRKFLHCDKVQYLSVPQYEGLGIKEFLIEAEKYP